MTPARFLPRLAALVSNQVPAATVASGALALAVLLVLTILTTNPEAAPAASPFLPAPGEVVGAPEPGPARSDPPPHEALQAAHSTRVRRPALREPGRGTIDFDAVNAAALAVLPALLERWLPDGRIQAGREYVARNPRRNDRRAGSFKINLQTGRWADFATGDKGGDVVSLAAFLANTTQIEAARELAAMLGLRR